MCSYAQGYNIIRAKSQEQGWDIDLGALARIWKGGCIIRAGGRAARGARGGASRVATASCRFTCFHYTFFSPCAAGFLDRIKQAYQRNPELPNLLVDPAFAQDLADR